MKIRIFQKKTSNVRAWFFSTYPFSQLENAYNFVTPNESLTKNIGGTIPSRRGVIPSRRALS